MKISRIFQLVALFSSKWFSNTSIWAIIILNCLKMPFHVHLGQIGGVLGRYLPNFKGGLLEPPCKIGDNFQKLFLTQRNMKKGAR